MFPSSFFFLFEISFLLTAAQFFHLFVLFLSVWLCSDKFSACIINIAQEIVQLGLFRGDLSDNSSGFPCVDEILRDLPDSAFLPSSLSIVIFWRATLCLCLCLLPRQCPICVPHPFVLPHSLCPCQSQVPESIHPVDLLPPGFFLRLPLVDFSWLLAASSHESPLSSSSTNVMPPFMA